ncbi:MAG: prolyl oligopeptidase family serine peptidase, partial [Candidatus Latescibacteria bacterium]|nr:prolyl oligopeptidase family serine peptidase [Candidatus Latescibacterota bacterium]
FFVYVRRSLSGRFIYIHTGGNNMDEWRFLDANDPEAQSQMIEGRRKDFEYDVVDHGDRFLIRNNGDGAKDFRISETVIATPEYDNWTDFLPHESGRLIRDVIAFENHLAISERQKGLPEVRVIDLAGDTSHLISFDEEAYAVWPEQGREWQTTSLRFSYMSMTTPEAVYDYDMESRERVMRKQTEVLGGFNAEDYESKRIWATVRDGAQVPISMVYKKGVDGSAPLLLYGYGSYGSCAEAEFVQERFSLLDRGFIWAIAHMRGGMEMGWDWYENGKLLKKKNTFTDFIDCAEHLIQEGYTQSDRLFARGGSAGGLLMGAVTNMRPDLFAGVIAGVPFVDTLTT